LCVDRSEKDFDFEGVIIDKLKQGIGHLKSKYKSNYHQFDNFVEYFGEFENNNFHGIGRLETENFTYLGNFRNGRISGVGFLCHKKNLSNFIG
jgi:hypothetical protein